MRTAHILLLCFLGAALLSTVVCHSGPTPDDCCFKYYPRRINKTLVDSYYLTDDRCSKSAVVLVTKQQGRRICVDPSLPWVQGIMKYVDLMSF